MSWLVLLSDMFSTTPIKHVQKKNDKLAKIEKKRLIKKEKK